MGVVVESQEGVVQLSNPAFRKMFGYSNEDIAGKSIDQLVATGELRQEAEAISRQVHSGWSFHRILKRTRKDGSLLDVEAFAAALAGEGKAKGQMAIYVDISRRVEAERNIRDSEELFRTLSSTAPIGIFRSAIDAGRDTFPAAGWPCHLDFMAISPGSRPRWCFERICGGA